MNLFEAIFLGIVQGITEFLPISSSGHLVLVPWVFGWTDPGLGFNVALHLGTLAGVLIYFRRDLGPLLKGAGQSLTGNWTSEGHLAWKIGLATIPGALMGLLLEEYAEHVFRSPWIVSGMLIIVGLLLLYVDKKGAHAADLGRLTWIHAILIGIAQGIAIIPGTSRSGITILAALFLGYNRSAAVRFSFLLSIPIIFGAGLVKIEAIFNHWSEPTFIAGVLSAAISGFLAIRFMVNYVKTKTFTPFVFYRIGLALIIVVMILSR